MKPTRLLAMLLCLALPMTAGLALADDQPHKKKKKAKKDEYAESKYKSYNVLTDADAEKTYRFDANGNPILPEGAKKKAAKKKKKAAPKDDEGGSDSGSKACAGGDCASSELN